jgi:hypothetical protein
MAIFDSLGFQWDRTSVPREVPRASVERAIFRFRRMLPEYVWDAGVLEGNPFTFPEVKTLLEGVTVGGRKLSDQEQILNLAESSKRLITLVAQGEFAIDKPTFCELQGIVARNEALEWGHFRGEGAEIDFTPDVALGERGRFTPLPTAPGAIELNRVFSDGVRSLEQDVLNPFEHAMAFYFFGALQQFFFDGNKRTSRFMMNGALMSKGIDAVSIPAARAQEFNSKMVDFYISRDATPMMAFIVDCHPGIDRIREINDNIYGPVGGRSLDRYSLDGERGTFSGPADQMPHTPRQTQPPSLEEVRRMAREDWLRTYHGKAPAEEEPVRGRGLDDKGRDPLKSQPGFEDDLEG